MTKIFNRSIAALIITCFLSLATFADQAEYVTREQAEKAAAILRTQKEIRHYCGACEDKGDRIETITSVEAEPAGYQNYWQVKVNGSGIDLAYVYFRTKKGKWKNLAIELKIEVTNVPKHLED